MIHSISRTSGLFEPEVADEINNAFSDVNDKIEKFERPMIYNTLDVLPVQVKAEESFSIVNNSIKTGNIVYITLTIEVVKKVSSGSVDVCDLSISADGYSYGPYCIEGKADAGIYKIDGQHLSIGTKETLQVGTVIIIQDYFIVGA